MAKKDEELSDKELGSLLSDLSSRADTQPKSAKPSAPRADAQEDDGEDIEAFLKSLEGDDYQAPEPEAQTAVAEKDDPFEAQFAELDAIQPDDLPAKAESAKRGAKKGSKKKQDKKGKKKKKSRRERAAEKKAQKARAKAEKQKAKEQVNAEQSRAKKLLKKTAKAALIALPALLFSWVLGAYLGNLISAGWLIAILSLLLAFGLPLLVVRLTKRGKYVWWTLGLGIAMTLALLAPMPNTTADTLTRYGHWPATALTEVAGWQPDNALVQFNAAASKLLGGVLGSGAAGSGGPRELGTTHTLYGVEPAQPDAPGPSADPEDIPTGAPPPVQPAENIPPAAE